MKDIIYVRVYIEGKVENLPTIEDEYYVHTHEDGLTVFNWYGTNFSSNWLNQVDWYLMPKELPDDEEIKLACPQKLIARISCWIQGAKWFKSQILK